MARFALARATLFSFVCSYWNLVLAAPSSSPSFTPKSFLSISHPTLPEYFIRLTQPDAEICDPSVTQVRLPTPHLIYMYQCGIIISTVVIWMNQPKTSTFSFGSLNHVTIQKLIHWCFGSMEVQVAHP